MLRYRLRVLWIQIGHARPTTLDSVQLVLAVIGAWSVIGGLIRWFPSINDLARTAAPIITVTLAGWFYWRSIAHHPENIFRIASRTEHSTQKLRRWLLLGMQNDRAYATLERLYEPLFKDLRNILGTDGIDWPLDAHGNRALVFTLPARHQQPLDELLHGPLVPRDAAWSNRVGNFAGQRQMYMAMLRRDAAVSNPLGDKEGYNLVLDRLEVGSDLKLATAKASYGQIVRTSDALIDEFALFSYISSHSSFRHRDSHIDLGRKVLDALPWRRQVHNWSTGTDLMLEPRARAAGIGVAVVLSYRDTDDTLALIARRSSRVGTYPDAMHVIPAGMVNLRTENIATDNMSTLPRLTMLSEFLEECFNVEELSGHSLGNYSKRVRQKLEEFRVTDLQPVFLGLAIDLLNLRTEICGTIDLSERTEVVDEFTISWEYTHNEELRKVAVAKGSLNLLRTDSVQSGLGALHLAARATASDRPGPAGGATPVNHDKVTVVAPARVDLSAGFPDVPPFCEDSPGHIVNAALRLSVTVVLIPSVTPVEPTVPNNMAAWVSSQLGLPDRYAVDTSTAQLTPGSGLGSSGALAVGVTLGLLTLQHGLASDHDPGLVARLAVRAERAIGIMCGTQDQWSSVCGGIGLVTQSRTTGGRTTLHPHRGFLQDYVAVVHPGGRRNSDVIIRQVLARSRLHRTRIRVQHLSNLALDLARALDAQDISGIADAMNSSRNGLQGIDSRIVSQPVSKRLLSAPGLLGAKPCGAGGSSAAWVLLVDPDARPDFERYVSESGYSLLDPEISPFGARVLNRPDKSEAPGMPTPTWNDPPEPR